jgi:hypothetical protein
MVRTITGKTKGKAKERPKRQAACINQRRERASPSRDKNLSNRSRTSISRQRNLPIYSRKLVGFFFQNKENKPTNQEPCCCRFFFFFLSLLPLKLHRSLQKTGAPLGPFATYWVLTDCVHQCTSPCCVEQRRHKNPLSQPVPDLHPNLHPKSRCTQISLPLSLSNWSCC